MSMSSVPQFDEASVDLVREVGLLASAPRAGGRQGILSSLLDGPGRTRVSRIKIMLKPYDEAAQFGERISV